MKLQFDREKFLAAFQTVSSVAPPRSPKPILQNVKLEATPESTVVLATDLEMAIRAQVQGVECTAGGHAILNVNSFGSILRQSSDATLRVESDGQTILVRGERSEFQLPAVNPDEYPQVADFQETSYHEVSGRLLRELIRRTAYATDAESSRYALGGVLLEMTANEITAVGTDGRRLARMQGPARSVGGHETTGASTIVPTKAVLLVERSLADADEMVQISARANDVLVRSPRVSLYARLVEGRYPKWRDVFPKREGQIKVELHVGTLAAAVRQAAVATNTESKGIDFLFGDGKLVLSGRAANVGQSRVELPISYDAEPLGIMLDPKYLVDFLKVLDQERTFTLELRSTDTAAVCLTDDGYGYVIMPLQRDR